MALTGPIPKRDDERIRRNKAEVPTEKVVAIGAVEIPELGFPAHPLVVDLFDSMKDSAQSRFYEPSDWQMARLTMWELNTHLCNPKPSAMYLTAVNQLLSNLLLTEGDRRRVRIEVERNQNQEQVGKVLEVADLFRQALTNNTGQVPGGS